MAEARDIGAVNPAGIGAVNPAGIGAVRPSGGVGAVGSPAGIGAVRPPVGIGIVGLGEIGQVHLRGFQGVPSWRECARSPMSIRRCERRAPPRRAPRRERRSRSCLRTSAWTRSASACRTSCTASRARRDRGRQARAAGEADGADGGRVRAKSSTPPRARVCASASRTTSSSIRRTCAPVSWCAAVRWAGRCCCACASASAASSQVGARTRPRPAVVCCSTRACTASTWPAPSAARSARSRRWPTRRAIAARISRSCCCVSPPARWV